MNSLMTSRRAHGWGDVASPDVAAIDSHIRRADCVLVHSQTLRRPTNSPTSCQNKLRSDAASRRSRYTTSAPLWTHEPLTFHFPQ